MLGVLHRVIGVLHRVLGVLHRVIGVLHRVLGVLHRVLGVLIFPNIEGTVLRFESLRRLWASAGVATPGNPAFWDQPGNPTTLWGPLRCKLPGAAPAAARQPACPQHPRKRYLADGQGRGRKTPGFRRGQQGQLKRLGTLPPAPDRSRAYSLRSCGSLVAAGRSPLPCRKRRYTPSKARSRGAAVRGASGAWATALRAISVSGGNSAATRVRSRGRGPCRSAEVGTDSR